LPIFMDPEILVDDGPFVGLDPISMGVIVRLVRKMNDALGISSIIVSHDVQEISTVADCTYLISHGRVVGSGSPDELHNTSSEVVRQFMHGMADGPVAFHYAAPDYAEQLRELYVIFVSFLRTLGALQLFFLRVLQNSPGVFVKRFGLV